MSFFSKIKKVMMNQGMPEWKSKSKYQDLAENTDDEEQSNPCLEKGVDDLSPQRLERRPWSKVFAGLPWLLTLIFIFTTAFQYKVKKCSMHGHENIGSFEQGYASDFYPAKPYIKTELVRFTGSPAFDANHTMFLPHPDPFDYNGNGPEVDEAWEKLTEGRYILITEEEAHRTWGEDYTQYWDPKREGYVAGLDMFHTLHCVSRLAKMTPEILRDTLHNHNQRMHYHHCLSQLRQYVMCAGDLTPIPTKYYEALGRNYVDSDMFHTCRNFEQLRDWLTRRYYSVDD